MYCAKRNVDNIYACVKYYSMYANKKDGIHLTDF